MWATIVPAGNEEGSDSTLPKAKRVKVDVACDTCRLRKSRCDAGRPKCGACLRRKNVPPACVYAAQPSPLMFDSTPKAPTAEAGDASDSGGGHCQSKDDPVKTDDEAAAGGGRNWILTAGLLAASNSASFFNTVFRESPTINPSPGDTLVDDAGLEVRDGQAAADRRWGDRPLTRPSSVHSADYVLPSRPVADTLIHRFFKNAYIHWIDRLRFMRWYNNLWAAEDKPVLDGVEEQIHFANLNIIFALVYQSEWDELAEDQSLLAQTYFLRSQKLLRLCLLDLNRMDLLWTLLLLTQWLQGVNDVRGCTSLVGLCILIARNLGLHKPDRIDCLSDQYRREMARRAWHGCILMDRITAMISGQPLQISQDMAKGAPLFSAIDDEYLSTRSRTSVALGVQAPGKPSGVSFFLVFCQLHLILGDVLDHQDRVRQHDTIVIDINHIVDIDGKLDAFRQALPPHLHISDKPADTYHQKANSAFTGPMIHLHARILHIRILLYRIFFLHAARRLKHSATVTPNAGSFVDAVTHQGMLTCIRTAKQILDLIRTCLFSDGQNPQVVLQWWHIVTYVYTAVTILIAAHIFPEVVEELTTADLAASIQMGLQILSQDTRHTESARRCRNALTVLCNRYVTYPSQAGNVQAPRAAQLGSTGATDTTELQSAIWNHSPDASFDEAGLSVDCVRDFTGASDLLSGDGIESLLFFNTDLWGQEMGA